MLKQVKPPINHDDWTPLPEEWLEGKDKSAYQLINMQSNGMLLEYQKMMAADTTFNTLPDQRLTARHYSTIAANILKHRGLQPLS